jgi:isocitrate lyase
VGSNINPISFFGMSNVIENGQISGTSKLSDNDVRKAFLQLLLEKVYLNGFQTATPLNNTDSNDEDFSVFSQDMSNTFVNDMFRQQISEQMIQSDVFNISDLGGTP